jgi:hypothetical protein
MSKRNILLVLILVAIGGYWFFTKPASPVDAPVSVDTPQGFVPVTSQDGITFSYPSRAELFTEENREDVRGRTYIPVCDADTMTACVLFDKELYPQTTFTGAAVSLSVLPLQEASCFVVTNVAQSDGERIFDGVQFQRYEVGDAAMSHYLVGQTYRGWQNGRCVELKASMMSTNIGVYEPGTIQEFAQADQDSLWAEMNAILDSVRFVQ